MTIHFVDSPETWIRAWAAILDESPTFETAAAGWGEGFDGSILLSVVDDGTVADPPTFYVEPHDGGVREARVVADPSAVEAGFRLSASLETWERLVTEEIDPAMAVTGGELGFEGDPMVAMQYGDAVEIMIAAAAAIDTEFPG
jgi:putative sterol carrier protein